MGKKVGDTLDYIDQRGRPFKVRIVGAVANSILQGSLLIDEKAFLERFPSESGYRMFLIDAPSNQRAAISAALTRALRDVGLELTPATVRLAALRRRTPIRARSDSWRAGLVAGQRRVGGRRARNVSANGALLAVGFASRLRWLVLSGTGRC
jgi:hypothetical protein